MQAPKLPHRSRRASVPETQYAEPAPATSQDRLVIHWRCIIIDQLGVGFHWSDEPFPDIRAVFVLDIFARLLVCSSIMRSQLPKVQVSYYWGQRLWESYDTRRSQPKNNMAPGRSQLLPSLV